MAALSGAPAVQPLICISTLPGPLIKDAKVGYKGPDRTSKNHLI
jgi:hypothetical protein